MNRPETNEAFDKVKRREHKTFGGKTVDILYGAIDEQGNPTMVKEDADDGHGVWSGILVGDEYRMFVWKHSKQEGGAVEYGTEFKEDALKVMEEQILTKRDLARTAEEYARTGKDDEEALKELQDQWNALTVWNVPTENEYTKRYEKAINEIGPKLEEMKNAADQKQKLVEQVNGLLEAVNFKNARKDLENLKEQLSSIGFAGEKKEAEFHETVRNVENTLRAKQKEFQANLDSTRSEAEQKKNEIIAKTKEAVKKVSNYKDTNATLNQLFEDWKKIGSAGREADEKLWTDFNTLRQEFYDARTKFFDDRAKQLTQATETKKNLIAEAKAISEKNDFGKAATDRMKKLDFEWRAAGYSGKDSNDSLWNDFNEAKETFWAGKKEIFKNAVETDIKKAEEELKKLEKEIDDLEYRLTVVPNPSMKKDVEGELYLKKKNQEKKTAEIETLKKKISD